MCDFADQSLERQLANQGFRRPLISTYLAKSYGSRLVAVRFLNPSSPYWCSGRCPGTCILLRCSIRCVDICIRQSLRMCFSELFCVHWSLSRCNSTWRPVRGFSCWTSDVAASGIVTNKVCLTCCLFGTPHENDSTEQAGLTAG